LWKAGRPLAKGSIQRRKAPRVQRSVLLFAGDRARRPYKARHLRVALLGELVMGHSSGTDSAKQASPA
jgi:hypothetical protein